MQSQDNLIGTKSHDNSKGQRLVADGEPGVYTFDNGIAFRRAVARRVG
jgi:hypothetical protein